MEENKSKKLRSALLIVSFFLGGIAINFVPNLIAKLTGLELYLDSIGTIVCSAFSFYFPSVLVGFASNAAGYFLEPYKLYYGIINVFVALSFTFAIRRGMLKSVWKTIVFTIALSLICGISSATITYFINGKDFGEGVTTRLAETLYSTGGLSKFTSLLFSSIIIDVVDKSISVGAAYLIFIVLPKKYKSGVTAVFSAKKRAESENEVRKISLLTKLAIIVAVSDILLGALASAIGYYIYDGIAIKNYADKCRGATESAVLFLDPDKVDEYIANGREDPEYGEIEKKLFGVKNAFPQIEYVYAYKIEEDGCHVVFDLSTEDLEGEEPGTVIEFDESFEDLIPTLLEGGEIDPIITNDTYGYLLTVYTPVRNDAGECVCYMAADILMDDIIKDEVIFIVKLLTLFFSVSVIVLTILIELVERDMIFHINSMAKAANDFAFDIDRGSTKSLSEIERLDIRSGDEAENLYNSLLKMAEDSVQYIEDLKLQSEIISNMRESIIMDFAELVEARDKCTGDHVKKTSFYVGLIAEKLKEDGKFPDILTDDYIAALKRSAPMHDIGKIRISDIILNKPGRLDETEFTIMKTHTNEGEQILKTFNTFSKDEDYLLQAVEMAAYHHEWWNGRGYPYGKAGEDIPLSARIMAVADVFDALVSRRSYKDPFSFDKALEIIKEESGTHFDPVVVETFLEIAETLRPRN